jgi:hypothetical protein
MNLKINRLLESQVTPGKFSSIFIRGGAVTLGTVDREYISSLPVEYGEDGFITLLDEAIHDDFFRVVVINLDDDWLTVCNCRKTDANAPD